MKTYAVYARLIVPADNEHAALMFAGAALEGVDLVDDFWIEAEYEDGAS